MPVFLAAESSCVVPSFMQILNSIAIDDFQIFIEECDHVQSYLLRQCPFKTNCPKLMPLVTHVSKWDKLCLLHSILLPRGNSGKADLHLPVYKLCLAGDRLFRVRGLTMHTSTGHCCITRALTLSVHIDCLTHCYRQLSGLVTCHTDPNEVSAWPKTSFSRASHPSRWTKIARQDCWPLWVW